MSSHLQAESGPAHRRNRSNSKAQIESAIHAIQQSKEKMAAANAAGGYMGGPPAAADGDVTSPGATGLHHRTSLRHKKDTTLFALNGKRVRTTDRICNEVPHPANFIPAERQFWSSSDPAHPKPSLSFLKTHFQAEGRLSEEQALYILTAATHLFEKEPNMLTVGDGVTDLIDVGNTVCGDIHGQYYDLLKLFEVGGDPAETPYLFLGDYVDRGAFGIECLLYLYVFKIHYPTTFFLLRGNHECRHLTKYFTFANECIRKYSAKVYEACLTSFNALPIAALMDNRFLCLHGGLSPDMHTLDDIQAIDRFREPPTEGILCDILWSDPIESFSRIPEPNDPPPPRVRRYAHRKGKAPARGNQDGEGDLLPPGFIHNHIRGCSFFYDYTAVTNFLERNRLISLIRGHEVQDTGYRMYRSTNLNFPALITVFSAPNYLDVHHNRAAVIKYITHNITIRQFNGQPHPYTLPGHLNAFSWSLPFVAAKITEMMLALLNIYSREELDEEDDEEDDEGLDGEEVIEQKKERQEAIRNKILSVGRMARVFELLRSEAEGASELAYTAPETDYASRRDSRLGIQNQKLSRSIMSFEEARKLDLANERLPDTPPQTYRARSPVPDPNVNYRSAESSTSPLQEYASAPSFLSFRHRSGEEDTNTMIKRTLEGRDDKEEEEELLRLAARLSKPLTGKEHVKRAYGAHVPSSAGRLRRLETT
ncbi:hypothetical protein Clacol_007218 [Clathrus columnatus]|uniref:Serine/threonine-protein phosphatase n=1 Tax=Clathrus columnatus TaxID=1419009 RepID=A0AAV5AJ62_9AGAM|nr:hypothetical protein Clacol_007218 [Clathrus columnatus]